MGITNVKGRFIHVVARQSPYPATSLARFPVFDKYVPWEVGFYWYLTDYNGYFISHRCFDLDKLIEGFRPENAYDSELNSFNHVHPNRQNIC